MNTISLFDALPTNTSDTSTTPQPVMVELFDSPMCCSTGLCGPTVDQTLLTVNEMVMTLQSEGISVERYQMTNHHQKLRRTRRLCSFCVPRKWTRCPSP